MSISTPWATKGQQVSRKSVAMQVPVSTIIKKNPDDYHIITSLSPQPPS